MRKLEIVVNVLVLVVTLAAYGAVGVELAAAAGAVTKVESAMVLRTRDTDFIRHNYGINPWAAKAEAMFERRAGDGDFVDYSYGTKPWAAKAVVNTKAVATFEQVGDGDFVGSNYGTYPWTAKAVVDTEVDTRQSLQTLDCHPNEW